MHIYMKESPKGKPRKPVAGIMLMLLYLSKKSKVLIAVGAILIAISLIGLIYYGSIVISQASQGKMNPVSQSPYPVNGIDPFFAEKASVGVLVVGLIILGLGLTSRGRNGRRRSSSNLAELR